MKAFFTQKSDCIIISVIAQPKSSKAELGEVVTLDNGKSYLKVKLFSPPEDGKANREIIEILAKYLNISKSHFSIISGEKARRKLISITHNPENDLILQRLNSLA